MPMMEFSVSNLIGEYSCIDCQYLEVSGQTGTSKAMMLARMDIQPMQRCQDVLLQGKWKSLPIALWQYTVQVSPGAEVQIKSRKSTPLQPAPHAQSPAVLSLPKRGPWPSLHLQSQVYILCWLTTYITLTNRATIRDPEKALKPRLLEAVNSGFNESIWNRVSRSRSFPWSFGESNVISEEPL